MQSLRNHAVVTYTVPVDANALALLKELDDLEAEIEEKGTVSQANQDRRVEIGYALPTTTEVRVTLASPTAYDMAHYDLRRVKMVARFKEVAGIDVKELFDDPDKFDPVERDSLINMWSRWFYWAVAMTTIERIETRERRVGGNAIGEWQEEPVPLEWRAEPDPFLQWVPDALLGAIMETSRPFAPGLWGGEDPLATVAAKYVGINVNR